MATKIIEIDTETGETAEHREPKYVKLYLKHICDLNNTPAGSRSVLFSMVKRMQYDGVVAVRPKILEAIANECGLKGKTKIQQVRNKLTKLTQDKFLSKVDTGTYAVNPWYFGRGEWRKILEDRHHGIEGIRFTTVFTDNGAHHSAEIIDESDI